MGPVCNRELDNRTPSAATRSTARSTMRSWAGDRVTWSIDAAGAGRRVFSRTWQRAGKIERAVQPHRQLGTDDLEPVVDHLAGGGGRDAGGQFNAPEQPQSLTVKHHRTAKPQQRRFQPRPPRRAAGEPSWWAI